MTTFWVVVVIQLVERSPLTPKIRSSGPDIVKLLSNNLYKEKEAGNGQIQVYDYFKCLMLYYTNLPLYF